MQTIQEVVREAETNYLSVNTNLGKYVNWSMHDTIETVDAYLNSKHISGDVDSMGREKPFFNIVTAATNIWYRATDIDRKDIKFIPQTQSSVILAFVANVILQNWMDKNRFGQFLNQWGRELARYGSAISKFVEKDGTLIPTVVTWNRFIPDPIEFDAIPKIEKMFLTPAQLRKNKNYNQKVVDSLIAATTARETLDGQDKDNQDNFIEIYEVHGELDDRLLEDSPQLTVLEQDIKYVQQMHVVAFVQSNTEPNSFDDFTLFKGKEAKDPYQKDDLIEEDGRTLAIGAVEHLFNAQWMQNHTVKNMKDTLDISSKLIFQTADSRYVGRNVLNAIETGDIFIHKENQPLTRVANDKPDISALQNFGIQWQNLAQEITNTPDITRGITQAQPLTFGLGQILNNNSNSLFEIMTENKGLAIEDMLINYIIPHIKKKLKNTDEIVGMLDDAGVQEIDSIYIPQEAIKRFNKRSVEQILAGEEATVFDQQAEEQAVKDSLAPLGNKRFFKPDELGKKQWDEIMSDFQWDNIKVEVVNENADKQFVMQTLAGVFQTLASNPAILQDANARTVFNSILQETGKISPLQLTTAQAQAPQVGVEVEELSKIAQK